MKVVRVSMKQEEFLTYMTTQYDDFLKHVERVRTQYSAIRCVKENLPGHQIIVHMDFAESFTCCNADEVKIAGKIHQQFLEP